MEQNIEQLKQENAKLAERLNNAGKFFREQKAQIESLTKENDQLKNDLLNTSNNINDNKEVDILKKTYNELFEEYKLFKEEHKTKISNLDQQLSDLKQQYQDREDSFNDTEYKYKNVINDHVEKASKMTDAYNKLQEDYNKLKDEYKSLEVGSHNQVEAVNHKYEDLKETFMEYQEKNKNLDKVNDELKNQLNEYKIFEENKNKEIGSYIDKLHQVEEENKTLKLEIENINQIKKNSVEVINQLNKKDEELKSLQSEFDIYKSKNNESIQKIIDTLNDLVVHKEETRDDNDNNSLKKIFEGLNNKNTSISMNHAPQVTSSTTNLTNVPNLTI